jgi:enoyl-[acyl-carrier protein] reductase I
MNFLDLENKNFLLFGWANRKSVAWHVGSILEQNGANVFYGVRNDALCGELCRMVPANRIFVCDFENEASYEDLSRALESRRVEWHGLLHSVAYARYTPESRVFHATQRRDFLQATTISAFSLVELARTVKPFLNRHASVVTVGISSQVTAVQYGYMSPIKAGLESMVRFLAKSFSADSEIRFNIVNSGPLKTSASAGIPGFLDNYLFAEQLTLRKRALQTSEVANVIVFLLGERSSGINGQAIVVNAGMDFNYFDDEVVRRVLRQPES